MTEDFGGKLMRVVILPRTCSFVLAVVGAAVVAPEACSAQRYSRQSAASRIERPSVSPYMNLYRRGSNGLPNYQTLVRPELQQLQTNALQQSAIADLRSQVATDEVRAQTRSLPQTGHESRFRFYSHFYSRKR